ncbi:hypothetical protein LSH36_222g04001 [Paralvinella palmiformis]|uniref:Uncharacterized protein n=1 Tax=Paralvinella palmiformis TaxID=53620 RepID=A0AAD9JN40_9ANNE|nr:hypothetical protein LSH36_222g04001 [Paralvinella palmiformis]
MLLKTLSWFMMFLVMMRSCKTEKHYTETATGYGKSVLLELCQFVGVKYIRNTDNPECSYIACWDRTPYNMPCPPGLMVHPLFFWGGSYPCIEPDTNNKCIYIHNFIMGRMSKPYQVGSKQGSRDSASEAFRSRDKMATKIYTPTLQESVYGGGETYNRDLSVEKNYRPRVKDHYQPEPKYGTFNAGRHENSRSQSKPIPLRQEIPYFSPYENIPTQVRSPLRRQNKLPLIGDDQNEVRTSAQLLMTSKERLATKNTPTTVKVTTGNNPEETLKLADPATLKDATTAHAPTAAITELA